MTAPLTAWLSPHDPVQTYADVLALVRQIQRACPDTEVRLAIPTLYGVLTQGEMERPTYRALGDELCPASVDGYAALRARFETDGVPCDGWSVPRGTGDIGAEGALHGQMACVFDRFFLNSEWGWDSFWTHPHDVGAINTFLGGLWDAVGDHSLTLGWTMVPNSMLDGSTDAELQAWAGGTHLVALETYLPSDKNLDPYNGLAKWWGRADAAGIKQQAVAMVEKGELSAYIHDLADPEFGCHLWTLCSTASYWAAQPTPEPTPEPQPEPAIDTVWLGKKEAVVRAAGELETVADQLLSEANRRNGPRITVVRQLAGDVRARAGVILA